MSSLHIASRTPSPILFALPLCLFGLCLANAQDIPLSPPDDAPFESSAAPTRSVGPRGLAPLTSALKAPPDIGGGVWLAEGPGPALFGQVEGITPGPNAVVGAVHVIAAHPSDIDILYAGGANGGIWKTTNATGASPFWSPLTDFQTSLSMGALEFDPTDGTASTLVAGIGRYSSFDSSGGLRTGLLRTTDGGATWAAIDGGGVLTGLNISGVAPRGATIVASANDADAVSCADVGIWRSTDGGATFVKLSVGAGVPDGEAFDLASDALSSSTLYTGMSFGSFCTLGALPNGVYKSTNTGASWTKVSDAAMDALIVDFDTNNIEIAARGAHVYVNIIQFGRPVGIFHSADFGATWTAMDLPRTPEGSPLMIGTVTPGTPVSIDTAPTPHGLPGDAEEVDIAGVTGPAINGVWTTAVTGSTTFDLVGSDDTTAWGGGGTWQKVVGMSPKQKPGSQGGIHASIVIDPVVPTNVAIGGDRQDNPFPNFLGAGDFTARLFRGDTTVAPTGAIPSPQWEHMTHSNAVAAIPGGGTANGSAPHADSREMVWAAGFSDIIEGDDGGIYVRTFAYENTGAWFSINGNLQVTEQHDVAYDSVSDIIISGNQDTGTTQQIAPHSLTWNSVSTADGGDVAVDDMSVPGASTRYSSFQNLGAFLRHEYDASNVLTGFAYPPLTPLGVLTPEPAFVTPVVLNANTPTRLLIGACNAIFESMDRGDTIMEIAGLTGCPGTMTFGGMSGGMPDPDTIWASVEADVYQRVGAGGAFALKGAYPGGIVTDIVVDPTSTGTAYVTDATGKIYQSHDDGVTWTDISGNLTDTGLGSAAIDPGGRIFVGGREGVFELTLPAPGVPAACAPGCTWGELGGGSLPNAPVWDMEWDVADSKLVVGTLGRGAWTFQENGTCGFPKNMVVNNRMISTASLFKACNTISGGPALTVDATGPGSVDFVAGISVAIGNGTVLGGAGGVTVEIDSSLVSP